LIPEISRTVEGNEQTEQAGSLKRVERTDGASASPAIFVLGMHRSGTSAVARILSLAGAYLGEPKELLPSHPRDNPTGYWERIDLVVEHDKFLAESGFSWDRIANYEWNDIDDESRATLRVILRDVEKKLQSGQRPWLVKDPRLCLLLPVWLELAPDAACVIVVRDPREIAASLRESHRGVYTSHFLLALWERYLRSMLRSLEGRSVLFVSYEAILANPVTESHRLVDGLRKLGVSDLREPLADELNSFIDRGLNRSKPADYLHLSSDQEKLYSWLRAQCAHKTPLPIAGVPAATNHDAALAESEAASRYQFDQGYSAASDEAEGKLQTSRDETERVIADRDRIGSQLDHAQTQISTLLLEQSHLQLAIEEERDALRAMAAAHERERSAMETLRERERDEHAHLIAVANERHRLTAQHADALEASMRALRASLSWKITAPMRAIARWLTPSRSFNAEQRLHRLFYALPGFNTARKRSVILWLHRNVPWLTRHTLSYQLYEQTQRLIDARAKTEGERRQLQRMDEKRAAHIIRGLSARPLISLVMPVYNVDPRWLGEAVQSVRRQFYPVWQLCVVDDASTSERTRQALDEIDKLGDDRITIRRLPQNGGIAVASNAALEMAKGEYVGLLDNDDALTRDALLEVVLRIREEDADIIYSDEDKIDEDGNHVEPHFKPDFSLDYLLSVNYVCHFCVMRRDLMRVIGGFRTGFDGAQDYDLFLRATEGDARVSHISKVLYHWRKTPQSTATASAAKPEAGSAGVRALSDSMQRRAIAGRAESGPYPTTYRARRDIIGEPLASILIPFRDKPELLRTCVQSILKKTDYAHYEIIGIDNDSQESSTRELMKELEKCDTRIRFVRYEAPFNYSAVNNFGARHARGEHLLFLNNDTEIIDGDWLRAMLEHSQRPDVGVVGAKLLYSDSRIQHAGVIVGIGGVAGHAHLLNPADYPGYFGRAQLPQNLSAVTFACAMTRRDVFNQLGGLNEKDLTIAFNDIDFCLRAREAGYLVVYTPFATLFHHESRSRGYEDNPQKQERFAREIAYMQKRHHAILAKGDPYYNPQLSLTNVFEPDPRYVDALPL
jgi:O-antigen biosynthesis protein